MRPFTSSLATVVAFALSIVIFPASGRAQLVPEWVDRLPVGDALGSGLSGFVVDADGVSYLTGDFEPAFNDDIITAAIAPDGTTIWTQTWDGPQNGNDQARDIALGANGILYVSGSTPNSSSYANVLVLAYDAATGVLLDTIIYASGSFISESAYYIAVGANGEIYVAGSTNGDGADVAVMKFDSTGQLLWRQTWDGPAASPFSGDTAKELRLDPSGDPVVAIHGLMSSLQPDYVVIKYAASDGAKIWETNWGVSGGDYISSMEIDAAGNVYATGIGIDLIDKISTIKLRGIDGAILWQEYDSVGSDHFAGALELDGEGGLLIVGTSDPDGDNSNANNQFFTIKRDTLTGAQLWTHRYGATCVGCSDSAADAKVDSAGNVFLSGTTSSPPYLNDKILFVLDNATGLEIDRGVVEGVGSENPSSSVLELDAAFNLYEGGHIYNADTGALDITVSKWSSLVGDDNGIPCADTVRFQSRCIVSGSTNRLQYRLVLTDTSHDGEQVTVEVDGAPFLLPVNDGRAQTSINGALPGPHTIELTDPVGCFPAAVRTCPGS